MIIDDLTGRIRATIDAYVSGFSDNDLDAICKLYEKDATIEDPVGTPKKQGAEEIRAFYQMALSARPVLTITGAPITSGGFSATPIRAEVSMGGRAIVIDLISVMSFAPDGRIRSMTAYFDPGTIDV